MRKQTLRIALLLLLLFPLQALSMSRMDAHDTIAGLGETVELSGLDGTVTTFFIISPRGKELDLPVSADADARALVRVPGDFTTVGGKYRIFLGSQGKLGTEGSFAVLPEQLDGKTSTVETDRLLIKPNGSDEAVVTVTITDKYGNPLPGRPVKLNARPQDSVSALTNQTDDRGQQKFSVRTSAPGTIDVHAIDQLSTTLLDASAQIDADGGGASVGGDAAKPANLGGNLLADLTPSTSQVLDHFEITLDPASPKQKDFVKLLTITAEDAQGNVVTTYDKQVDIYVPTDPNAVLPAAFATADNPQPHGKVTFDPKRKGVASIQWGLSFSRSGPQTLVVDDGSGIKSQKTVTVTAAQEAGPSKLITVTTPADGSKVKGSQVVLKGSASPDINFHVDGTGISPAPEGKTGDDGTFTVTVPIDPGASDYALQLVNDENAGEKSDTLHLVRDSAPPAITLTLNPQTPGEGDEVTAEVKSDPGLPSVTMTVDDQQLSLTEATDAPGTYRVMFPAPKAGTYPVHVSISDAAGNAASSDATLTVAIAPVKNLRVTATKPYEADLTWDAYNWDPSNPGSAIVYVGTGSANFAHAYDTQSQANSAAITGLKPGQKYFFMVTIKQGNQEAKASDIVSAAVIGTTVTVIPKDGGLTLQWSFEDSVPLKGYLLEFNTDPLDANPDQNQTRVIDNGKTRFYDLRDLINGIPYHLRLTPLDVTGNALSAYAIAADGTPNGEAAFHPGPSISIGSTGAFRNALHGSAPGTPGSGLPPFALWIVLGGSLAGFLLYWRVRASRTQTQIFLQTMATRYRNE